jgi:hypothetical protein
MANKTRKYGTTIPKVANTFSELVGWRKHVFEHLGWMVLAKAKGMTAKVKSYKESVHGLYNSIKHHMSEYKDRNKQDDLRVLLMEVEILEGQMSKIL